MLNAPYRLSSDPETSKKSEKYSFIWRPDARAWVEYALIDI
jgi:ubiquinone/menaquinone biosynthesis C-methylase UbiE